MAKNVGFKESKDKMIKGFKLAAQAVGCTLGPNGKNVYLQDPTVPKITKDGVSIASRVMLDDPDEDAGAWVIRSATGRAADEAGDGTTTTAVIADALADECLVRPENPMFLRETLRGAVPGVIDAIRGRSKPTTLKDALAIAKVSAENDTLAELIVEIFKKKGTDAHILVEDSETALSEIKLEDGYEAKVGCMSPWLITDVKEQKAIYKEVPVLCSHKKINVIAELLPLYEALDKKKVKQLVIVCDEMNVDVLAAVIDNKRRGTFSTLVIRATGELLDDIAAVVGATPIAEGTAVDFYSPDLLKHVGVAHSVVSTVGTPTVPGTSMFVGKGKGGREKASMLEAQAKTVHNDIERRSLTKRAARLRSGIAVLKIGAYSEQERGDLRDKADDAIKAVKSALSEGYVEGGGMCLYRIAEEMTPATVGEELLKKALTAPLRKIIENGAKDYTEIVKNLPKGMGYNAKTGEYEYLIKSGIVDPAKVERIAVESAVSSVAEMITTNCLITDHVETKTA